MTERYAFRYTEYLIRQRENKVFFAPKIGLSPLEADICARFQGTASISPTATPWANLGVRVDGAWDAAVNVLDLVPDYGADACRIALLENKGTPTHAELTAAWREVSQIWHLLKEKPSNDGQKAYAFLSALQKSDFKKAWIEFKSLVRTGNALPLSYVYPFLPHLTQSLDADIHKKMSAFWNKVSTEKLPTPWFVEVNGHCVMDFYPTCPEKIMQEALSFLPVQNKIKGKQIQKTIIIEEKGINFVI